VKHIKSAWQWLVDWLEYGDLVPLLVLVSAFHYAAILKDRDALPVAIALGLIVDLGHFRTIRAAFRYSGEDRRHKLSLWGIALVMTAVSFAYHQRYYQDFWLSAPIPFLIAALAWLQKVDKRGMRGKPDAIIPKRDMSHTDVSQNDTTHDTTHKTYICQVCGENFGKSTALALHNRWKHAPEKVNGKVKTAV